MRFIRSENRFMGEREIYQCLFHAENKFHFGSIIAGPLNGDARNCICRMDGQTNARNDRGRYKTGLVGWLTVHRYHLCYNIYLLRA